MRLLCEGNVQLDEIRLFRLNFWTPRKRLARRKGALASGNIHRPAGRANVVVSSTPHDRRALHHVPNGMPVEIQVVQDRDIVLTELFQEEWLALNWSRAYCDRLKQQGWQDSPG